MGRKCIRKKKKLFVKSVQPNKSCFRYHLCIDFELIMPEKKYDKSRKNFAKFANLPNIEKLIFMES